jgi:hypothetical protein
MAPQRASEAPISFDEAHCEARAGIVETLIAITIKKMANLIMRHSKFLGAAMISASYLISRMGSRLRDHFVQLTLADRARRASQAVCGKDMAVRVNWVQDLKVGVR